MRIERRVSRDEKRRGRERENQALDLGTINKSITVLNVNYFTRSISFQNSGGVTHFFSLNDY